MAIGEKIRHFRQLAGMTQDELAQKVGYKSRSSINKVEVGGRDIPRSAIVSFAKALGIPPEQLLNLDDMPSVHRGTKIPVLGIVQAGTPIEAIENIIDYVDISSELADDGDYFALKVRGASMEPRIYAGDIVIVRSQTYIESSEIAVAMVNGDSATVKKIVKHPNGLSLVPFNPSFDPMFFSAEEVENLPVCILGKVVEVRGRL